jgi:hypothetical protein
VWSSDNQGTKDLRRDRSHARPEEVGSVSVIPFPAGSGPSDPSAAAPEARPVLHLVPVQPGAPCEHAWELRSVEYDESLEVRRYECVACDEVMFR